MAAQNRKTSTGRKGQTTKKGSSSGKKGSGRNSRDQSQRPDLLTIVVVLIAVVLVVVLISKYNKEQEGNKEGNPTGGVTTTGTVTPEAPTGGPGKVTDTAEPTRGATSTPEPEATPKPPTPTEAPVLTQAQAEAIVKKIVQLDKYSIELLDDHLMIDGAEYYSFCINDEDGVSLEPLLIVEKEEGMLLCYDLSGVVAPIERFPLDKTETGSEGSNILTTEEAKKVLLGYSGERLGLPKELGSYEITMDDWTTVAEGVECYGFSFFETVDGKQKFRGTFYVALNGSAVYSQDEVTGMFIKR